MKHCPNTLRSILTITLCLFFIGMSEGVLAENDGIFDHFKTGFPLDGLHQDTECTDCHVNEVFLGAPRECELCHSNRTAISGSIKSTSHLLTTDQCTDCHSPLGWDVIIRVEHASMLGSCDSCHNNTVEEGKPGDHISSSNECELCHTTNSWDGLVRVDHAAVSGSCSSCHNGVIAEGKHAAHVSTADECDSCHSTFAWSPATFDHIGIVGGCSGCHNGITAGDKGGSHILSTNLCENCHNTVGWSPVIIVDHNEVLGSCFSCHDNVTEPGKDPSHILSTNLCENCHTSITWSPVFTVDHNEVLGSCGSCHDGVTALGKPLGHFDVTTPSLDCDSCHSSVSWLPDFYTHTGAYPGDHRDNPVCTACHTSNAETIPWISPAYQPDCAGCHEAEWRSGPHEGATIGELRNCAGACHEGPGEHSVTAEEF